MTGILNERKRWKIDGMDPYEGAKARFQGIKFKSQSADSESLESNPIIQTSRNKKKDLNKDQTKCFKALQEKIKINY